MQTREIVALLFKQAHLLSWALALPMAIAVVLFIQAPREYESTAKILINARDEQPQSSLPQTNDAGPQTTAQEVVNSEVEFLTSQELANRTIEAVGATRLFPRIGRKADGRVDPDVVTAAFTHALMVKAVTSSHVIALSLRGPSPQIATEALNTFLRLYQQMHYQTYSDPATGLLHDQLNSYEGGLKQLNAQIEDIKRQNGLFDPDQERKDLLLNRATLSAAAMQLRAHAEEMRAKASALTAQRERTPQSVTQYPTADESDAMIRARAQLFELKQQQVKLSANYQPNSRAMKDNQAQIDGVQSYLNGETARFQDHTKLSRNPLYDQMTAELSQISTQIEPDRQHAAALDAQILQIDSRLAQIEKVETTLAPLQLQHAGDVTTVSALQQRATETPPGQRAATVKIIQKPTPTTINKPSKPKGLTYLAGGLAGGIMLGALLTGLTFALKNTYLMPESVEAATRIPVLVSLPVHSI
jgi:uncharacterized protein involved in exopolysaccharide biosynthesis